jgi:hypothetical protein
MAAIRHTVTPDQCRASESLAHVPPAISIVLPVYNQADHIERVVVGSLGDRNAFELIDGDLDQGRDQLE